MIGEVAADVSANDEPSTEGIAAISTVAKLAPAAKPAADGCC